MTDEEVERAFRQHPSFEKRDAAEFEATSTPFENTILADENPAYGVEVRAPMLDAVVDGEEVADVVETGWFETLELRLGDAHTVTRSDEATPPEIDREGDEVVVSVEFEQTAPEAAPEDALAIVEYVEGTWVQGVIPGYDYREPASKLVEQATQNYDEGEADERANTAGGEASGTGDRSGDSGGPPPM